MKVTKEFYFYPTRQVAQELLGKLLVRKHRGKIYRGIITETEAYCGPQDLASHASRGRTPRTEVMFGPPGRTYVYMIYGMYYCLNIVTEKKDYPAAVLIRAVRSIKPASIKQKTDGPGKLCRYFKIDKTLNNQLITGNKIWVEDIGLKPLKIKKLPRVGVDYAGEYKNKKWRFVFVGADPCVRPNKN
jgi:DNA-3-methyladenine glycosylase